MAEFKKPTFDSSQLSGAYGKVMLWLFFCFLALAGGIFILGPIMPPALAFGLFVVLILSMIVAGFSRKASELLYKLSNVLAIIVPVLLGAIFYPILVTYVAKGLGGILVMAALGTAIVFGVAAITGWRSQVTKYHWLRPMFGVLIATIVLSVLNAMFFQLPVVTLIISCVTLVLFTIYAYIDIQMVRDYAGEVKPSMLALNVFLDIWNIFMSILNIISSIRQMIGV